MKKVRHLPWYVKRTILAVLSIIFVSPAAYSQGPAASELIKDGTLNVPYTLSDGTVLPSPEAARMRRYTDHPVALNTGVLSVNIPLYTMSVGGYSLPIALSYHAAGIKADDEHCETGLGWSLLGGGCISRSVIGVPDEQAKSEAYNDDNINTSLLVKALHYDADTWYDRYSYSFAGYSGSFIIQGNSIQQLPQTDLDIDFCDSRDEGVRNFFITTPDGDRYYFTEREHTRYNYVPLTYHTFGPNGQSYEAVTAWHLSCIITANNTDTISYKYSREPFSRYDFQKSADYRSFSQPPRGTVTEYVGNSSYELSPYVHNEYPDKRILAAISSRTCRIEFSNAKYSSTNYHTINGMSVLSPDSETVRKVSFTYTSTNDGRVLLSGISVKDGDRLIDKQEFDYFPGQKTKHTDLFGYNNYNPSHPERTSFSVLDTDGKISMLRIPYLDSAKGYTLKKITDGLGATTTFEYEQSACDSLLLPNDQKVSANNTGTGNNPDIGVKPSENNKKWSKDWNEGPAPLIPGTDGSEFKSIVEDSVYYYVSIGLRIKSVTVTDPITKRKRIREFSYSNPVCTFPLKSLRPSSFISLGGTLTYNQRMQASYTTGATFTTSCRTPGAQLENATVYYGCVTEKTSGTSLDRPVLTRYMFDTSNVKDTYIVNATFYDDLKYGKIRYLGYPIRTVRTDDDAYVCAERVFGPQRLDGHVQESFWEKAPLVSKTTYRCTDNGYEPMERTVNRYSTDLDYPINTGLYVEGLTRYVMSDRLREAYDSNDDFNYFPVYVISGRLFKDSTIVTTFNEDGTSRTVAAAYRYDGRCQKNNLYGVSSTDDLSASDLHALQSVRLSCGNSTVERNWYRSANMKTAFYMAVSNKGMRMLPVMEKYISDDNDTVIVRNDYADFGKNGGVCPALSRITHRGTEVARQEFLGYDRRCNLLATRINSGVPTSYMWDTEASLPVAAIKGGIVTADQKAAEAALSSDSVLVTRYAYKPLVGCTAISYPNTRTVSYGYDGGRLSTISDTGGNVVKSYDYAIYSEKRLKGCNSVTEHTYTSAGKGTSVTTSTYYDSFGCPVNVVAKGASTDSRDLATLTEYDALDRTVKEWLAVPYSAANGPISQCDFLGKSSSEYDDSLAFRESQYELSPSAEAVRILQPGVAFSKRPYTTSFVGNRQSDAMYRCQRFVPSSDYTFRTLGSYADGELAVVKTVDADNRTVLTFTDWKGNKVLERHVLDGSRGFTADTYYVYDALGKLRFVLPPALDGMKETGGNSWDIRSCVPLRQYAYFYRYDDRMLLVEKKLPGADPVYYINDITGNAVFSQDGNLRKGNRWNFSIPDRFGRTAVKGLCGAPDAAAVEGMFVRVAKTDYANAASSICSTGYCPNIVLQAPSLLTADYYDDYRFLTLRQFEGLNRMDNRNARGLKTGTMTAVLKPATVYLISPTDKSKATPSEICSVVSYDSEDRIACVETSNILGGKDRTVTEYTFSGKPLSMTVTHTAAGKLTAEESYGYTYDALDRPLQTRYSINNGQSVTLADNRYDELGRLQSDRRNGSASLATEYSYNLHGMPTRISTPLYTESLFYEQPHNGSTPQYGGNISAIDWSVADESDTYGKRGYTFSYDGMSRLTAAGYLENGKFNNHFSTSYKYDLMGNILSLRREGLLDSGDYGTIDDLTYSYEGNQVVKIDDAADESPNYSGAMHFRDAANEETEYTYDANGNMLTDSNKGITSIEYNVLDLPQCIKTRPRIIFKESTGNAIYYTYSADGTKLRATYNEADSRTMPYKPNALYNNNTGIISIQAVWLLPV
jgi:YD repeat-containing protein